MSPLSPESDKSRTRSARREQLLHSSAEIKPLADPESIPLDEFLELSKEGGNPFMGLADYLAAYMSEWTADHMSDIGISMNEREQEHFKSSAYQNYFPGFAFMAYLFESVPSVCADAGINSKDAWIDVALSSKTLGERAAVQSTRVQACLVSLLIDIDRYAELLRTHPSQKAVILQESFDPRRLKLKGGRITLADDEAKTINYILDVVKTLESGDTPANCIALQVRTGDDGTIFDDFWNLYCVVAKKLYDRPRPATGSKKLHRTNLEMKRSVLDFLSFDLIKLQVAEGIPRSIAEQVAGIALEPHLDDLFVEIGKRSGNPSLRFLAKEF